MRTEPPNAEPPKRKRRWFQFSLRTLMIVVAIVAVQCAVCLPMLKKWQTQQKMRQIAAAIHSWPHKLYWTHASPNPHPENYR
jgi:Tfp pilus assembly major pilin PilA